MRVDLHSGEVLLQPHDVEGKYLQGGKLRCSDIMRVSWRKGRRKVEVSSGDEGGEGREEEEENTTTVGAGTITRPKFEVTHRLTFATRLKADLGLHPVSSSPDDVAELRRWSDSVVKFRMTLKRSSQRG